MTAMTHSRIHMIVEGKVQGVGFRYHTHKQAVELKLSGWVQNIPDGSVEIIAEGELANLKKFMAWVNVGPRNADVTNVHARTMPALNELTEFQIR